MRSSLKWWNKWWDHFFLPQKTTAPQLNETDVPSPQIPGYDLRFQLFGKLRCFTIRGELPEMSSPQQTLILAYFAYRNGRNIRRDELLNRFWPDIPQESARNSLNVALYHIRRHFRQHAHFDQSIILHHHGCYALHPDLVIQTDVEGFEQQVRQARRLDEHHQLAGAIKHYRKAIHLYRADFLELFPYEPWTENIREQFREQYLHALEELGLLHLRQDNTEAARFVFKQMLQFDPYLERGHQLLMWNYANAGQRDLAVRQFRKCEALLQKEFGMPPGIQTQNLYQSIREGQSLHPPVLSRA